MKVAIVTTSYPRDEADFAGRFVAETVERLRARGLEVDVVAPGVYRDFGLAYGGGVVHNVRKRPWAVPGLAASLISAVRRAARTADVVHAYWLPTGAAAALSGKPFVVSLPGTDMELARRAPRLARAILSRAKVALAHSEAIAAEARRLGATDVRIAPAGTTPSTTLTVISDQSISELQTAALHAGQSYAIVVEAVRSTTLGSIVVARTQVATYTVP